MPNQLSKLLGASLFGAALLSAGCAVVNKQETPAEYVSDASITTEIKGKLLGDKNVKANGVSVNTLKGMVQLSGFVQTPAEKAEAEAIARSAKGVTSVKNDIVVRP